MIQKKNSVGDVEQVGGCSHMAFCFYAPATLFNMLSSSSVVLEKKKFPHVRFVIENIFLAVIIDFPSDDFERGRRGGKYIFLH